MTAVQQDAPPTTRTPGLYPDIPEIEYHADTVSLSHSGAKMMLKAPALFKWQQDHPVHKDVFDFGSAAHALVLGVGLDVVIVQRELRNKKGELLSVEDAVDFKTNSAQEHRDKIRTDGKTPLLASDWQRVQDMAETLKSHRLAMRLLSDGRPEVSMYALDEPTGVMRRGRVDWLGTNYIIDFKTTPDADPAAFGRTAAAFGYDCQAAFYLDLAADAGHPVDAFGFISQMKEPPYLVAVTELDDDSIERGRRRNRRALEMYRDCSESGIWPGFQADGEIATVRLPAWAFFEEGM